MKEVTLIETMLKKISPVVCVNFTSVPRKIQILCTGFKKNCNKFVIKVGRRAGSLKTWEILNRYRTDLYISFHTFMNTFYEASTCLSMPLKFPVMMLSVKI